MPGVPTDGAYYEIALVEYSEKMHSDLPATRLRGYVQVDTGLPLCGTGTDPVTCSRHVPMKYPDGITPIKDANGNQVYAVDNPHYLGPLIIATKGTPTRIKFTNYLPTGAAGDLFLPVDTTIMGAGAGPCRCYGHKLLGDAYAFNVLLSEPCHPPSPWRLHTMGQ